MHIPSVSNDVIRATTEEETPPGFVALVSLGRACPEISATEERYKPTTLGGRRSASCRSKA